MASVVAIVPARGGSKGVPRKNVRLLAGKPMLAWTVEAALRSRSVTRCIVSTEDAEIAQTALDFGAEIPFIRPPELAGDTVDGLQPILHALDWLKTRDELPDYVVLLQPTSPLRRAEDIDGAIALALDRGGCSVISVCEVKDHPYHTMAMAGDGRMTPFLGGSLEAMQERYPRRQDLPPAYMENGAIYLARSRDLLRERSFYSPPPYAYLMPRERSVDVDDELDFRLAACCLEQ